MKALSVFVLSLAVSAAFSARTGSSATLFPPDERSQSLRALFHEYWEANLRHQPEFASAIGDQRFNDQVSDYSAETLNDWIQTERGLLQRLKSIDPSGLSQQDEISRELLERDLTDDLDSAEFKEWQMPVTSLDTPHDLLAQLVALLAFNKVKDYDDWIKRLRTVPKTFDQITANMRLGINEKRVPPRFLISKVLDEVKMLGGQKAEDSPFATPLKKFPDAITASEQARIKAEMLSVIKDQVQPAYKRLQNFLETTYIPAGRTEPGVSSLPNGAKYYQFLIHRFTTTDLKADQIHQLGLDEVRKDEAEMLQIAKRLGFKDLSAFRTSLKTNPKLKPQSREALLDAYRGYLTPMQARLPQLFTHLPKAPFVVSPVPDFLEKTASAAYYQAGTPDGSRPGHLFINTYNYYDRDLYDVESTAYHEGLPGHHLQTAIAQELEDIPDFRRFENYTAFTEGWALYSERLGKDLGLYQDTYSDYGRLQDDMLRAIRLVEDTGVHAQHWSRQQMIDYFHEHSAIDETDVQSEVDFYIQTPGRAPSYKIGQLEILKLRDDAKRELGDKFDLRVFHDQVIGYGSIPLNVLDANIHSWISSVKSGSR